MRFVKWARHSFNKEKNIYIRYTCLGCITFRGEVLHILWFEINPTQTKVKILGYRNEYEFFFVLNWLNNTPQRTVLEQSFSFFILLEDWIKPFKNRFTFRKSVWNNAFVRIWWILLKNRFSKLIAFTIHNWFRKTLPYDTRLMT